MPLFTAPRALQCSSPTALRSPTGVSLNKHKLNDNPPVTRFSNPGIEPIPTAGLEGASPFLVLGSEQRLPKVGGARERPPVSGCVPFLSLAEGGRAHNAEVSQGAEDVHDPDHRAVQVRLPSPRPVPAELQAHLSSQLQLLEEGASSILQGAPLLDNICLLSWRRMAGIRQEPELLTNIMYYFI